MGAWGCDTFENDAACDWGYELEEAGDLSLVEAALDAVLADEEECLDADLGSEALAACEVLARLQGGGGQRDASAPPRPS